MMTSITKKQIFQAGAAVFFLLFFSFHARAVEFGEGYDENTEVIVKGHITEIKKGMRGPAQIMLSRQGRIYNIVTAPMWYLKRKGIAFREGSELEVIGSRYHGEDGNIYVIAKKIKESGTGKEIFFRDASCRPMWHGMRNR
jgi:predicted heme/steroid binding protein